VFVRSAASGGAEMPVQRLLKILFAIIVTHYVSILRTTRYRFLASIFF
jgi:hypothetical protein